MTNRNNLYPIFVKMHNLKVLLVGAGNVGAEKLHSILGNCPEADILVVADQISREVSKLAVEHWNVRLVQRKFRVNDLDKRDLVFLATDDYELHKKIVKQTRKRQVLANVADTPDLCDFYLGSIVQKGDLKIGISTNGKSPTVAKRIRQFMEDAIPGDINILINNLHHYRNRIKGDFQKKVKVLNNFTRSLLDDNEYGKIHQN